MHKKCYISFVIYEKRSSMKVSGRHGLKWQPFALEMQNILVVAWKLHQMLILTPEI